MFKFSRKNIINNHHYARDNYGYETRIFWILFAYQKYHPTRFRQLKHTIKSQQSPSSSSITLRISQFLRNAEGRGGEERLTWRSWIEGGGEGYFIGLSVAFPLKRFRLPIPDFWRSQHYRKLSWFYLHARPKADYRWKCFFVPAASTAANKTCNHRQA